jgi:cellulose synthase/poly-beta-1,6-N-acetylglucosamine synthase-like glycosyltransferase
MMKTIYEMELELWRSFLLGLSKDLGIILFYVSVLVLTIYAIWYYSSIIGFFALKLGNPTSNSREKSESLIEYPRVAIIVPVYNDYEVLSTLQKNLELDYPDYVIVVVDDSTDPLLSMEISNLALRSKNKLIHVRRFERKGLKAGALNDALLLLEKYNPEYVMILDADFELPRDMLKRYVEVAVKTKADIVQGHQRHVKGSDTLFGILYRASQAGAILFMAGREVDGTFPIFTGSCALIRYELFREILFKEGSLSEDLRWTIDVLKARKTLRYFSTHYLYANGSVPRSQRAFVRQQVRWSSGTLREFLDTFLDVVLDRDIEFSQKLGYVLHGLFYVQSIFIYLATFIPPILNALFSINLGPVWLLGVYVWLIGIESLVIAGCVIEGYGALNTLLVAGYALLLIYYTAAIHMYGTLKALLSRKLEWRVTSKRGSYEELYRD